MAFVDDLKTGLDMFKQNAQELSFMNALQGANQQVSDIKASAMKEEEKRSALQQLSNQLVTHMASIGTPATTMQLVQGAIGPKQYANSDQMFMDAHLTGNDWLHGQAEKTQEDVNNPKFELQKMKAMMKMDPLRQQALDERISKTDQDLLAKYRDNLDQAKASSRSMFGQWAQTEGRSQRIQALLGNPNRPMTEPELKLAAEGLGAMVKGAAPTVEDSRAISAIGLKIQAAHAQALATGKPVPIDLSDWAKLYNNITNREDDLAKEKSLDAVLYKINGSGHLTKRPGVADGFKKITADSLSQLGITVDPANIQVDKKGNVRIPEIQPMLDYIDKTPALVKDIYRDLKSGDAEQKKKASDVLMGFGLTPDTSPADAQRLIRSALKQKIIKGY